MFKATFLNWFQHYSNKVKKKQQIDDSKVAQRSKSPCRLFHMLRGYLLFIVLCVIIRKKNLTLTNTIKPLPLDLFVFVHQSHRPSSLNLGQKENNPSALQPLWWYPLNLTCTQIGKSQQRVKTNTFLKNMILQSLTLRTLSTWPVKMTS